MRHRFDTALLKRHVLRCCFIFPGLLAVLVLNGCALIKLQQDIDMGEVSALLCGVTLAEFDREGPIVIVAYEDVQGKVNVAAHIRLSQSGAYELLVPVGRYYLAAFQDTNGNGRYDPGESWSQFGAPDLVDVSRPNLIEDLDMALSHPKSKSPVHLYGISIKPADTVHRPVAGEILDLRGLMALDNLRSKGYWEPISFLKDAGVNIWFAEPYHLGKIPVLFIHGAAGAPSDWNSFAENIDRSIFQPWFFSYPSGLPLEFNAYFLARKLYELHAQYRFEKMAIVAHSMGGLVTRSFLIHSEPYFPYIKLFVSISTPWGGIDTARKGVDRAPVVVPAWRDVASGSAFIRSLYQKRLPENTRFYLLFGYQGNRSPWRPNNDGAISMESMLDQRAQQEAVRVFGFNKDHVGILNSAESIAQYSDITKREMPGAAGTAMSGEDGQRAHGRIAVMMKIEKTNDADNIVYTLLVLEPLKEGEDQKVIHLDPFQTNQTIGFIPAGDYNVSMIIPAFDANPRRERIHISPGQTTTVSFTARPEGILTNDVWSTEGLSVSPEIESIQLEGPETQRILAATTSEYANIFDATLSHKDFIHDNAFCFFDLPKGNYRLTINAKDHQQYFGSYLVTPGQYGNIPSIQMTPE